VRAKECERKIEGYPCVFRALESKFEEYLRGNPLFELNNEESGGNGEILNIGEM
jgi:hypothetical protein